jgi:hypothetical protein
MKFTYFKAKVTHALKTWSLCGLHPLESSSHVSKDSILPCSFTKNMYVEYCEHFHNKNGTQVYHGTCLFKKGLFQVLTQNNIMKSCKNEPKTSHTIPYIFRKRNK